MKLWTIFDEDFQIRRDRFETVECLAEQARSSKGTIDAAVNGVLSLWTAYLPARLLTEKATAFRLDWIDNSVESVAFKKLVEIHEVSLVALTRQALAKPAAEGGSSVVGVACFSAQRWIIAVSIDSDTITVSRGFDMGEGL